MKIGTINYATRSGLGILTKAFWENGIINDILVILHPDQGWYPNHSAEWYPGKLVTQIKHYDKEVLENYIKNLDVLFLFETGFFDETITLAKTHNTPVVVMPMYEWRPFPMGGG